MNKKESFGEADEKSKSSGNRRVHMANERTFLAWIRTSIAIMAFGFVVEKFSLFVKQMSYYLGGESISPSNQSLSSYFGIALIFLGALMAVLAFIRFKRVEREIEEGTYRPSFLLDFLLLLSLLSVSLFLIIYLIHSL